MSAELIRSDIEIKYVSNIVSHTYVMFFLNIPFVLSIYEFQYRIDEMSIIFEQLAKGSIVQRMLIWSVQKYFIILVWNI